MAKKKKQKKAGVLKRQQNKQNKKRAIKRKEVARKPPEKKQMSMSKVKKNLKNLPNLIFEPELQELAFTTEEIQAAVAKSEKDPDQIEAIVTDEFNQKLLAAFKALEERFQVEKDANRDMMVKAMIYYMEQEQAPPYLNQIVVGLFYQGVAKVESPTAEFGPEELAEKLKVYDKEWEPYLEEKMEAYKATLEGEQEEGVPDFEAAMATPTPEFDTEEEEAALAPSPFESLIEEFSSYIADELGMEEDDQERTQEDVEVLFNDYCEEKEITELDQIRASKLRNFMEGWFIRMMHPTTEDLESMIDSMNTFFKFAESKEKIASEKTELIFQYLQDKESILANLNG